MEHLHGLLEKQFAQTLAEFGASRREWQILNCLPSTVGDLTRTLAPFWNADEPGPDKALAVLAERGWTTTDDATVALSDAGREAYERLAARVEEAHGTVLTGLTDDDYREVIRILTHMSANVEAALTA